MKMPESTKTFEKLEAFKEWMEIGFKNHCIKTYGERIFNRYILPNVNDMMENFEAEMESIAEHSIRDEELSYDEDLEDGFEQLNT